MISGLIKPKTQDGKPDLVGLLMQLSGLLSAGISSQNAMGYLQAKFDGLSAEQSAKFYGIWNLANRLGGSVLSAIERQIQILTQVQLQQREIELALSAPRATAKLVMGLPVLALLLAQFSGLNPVPSIFQSPVGCIAFALGIALMIIGRIWSDSMVNKAQPDTSDPAAGFDELVIALDAGLNTNQAITEVGFDRSRIAEVLNISAATGASLASLLVSEATKLRQANWHEDSIKISKLSVNLMIPLGLTSLPAFALIALVPVAIGLMTN